MVLLLMMKHKISLENLLDVVEDLRQSILIDPESNGNFVHRNFSNYLLQRDGDQITVQDLRKGETQDGIDVLDLKIRLPLRLFL